MSLYQNNWFFYFVYISIAFFFGGGGTISFSLLPGSTFSRNLYVQIHMWLFSTHTEIWFVFSPGRRFQLLPWQQQKHLMPMTRCIDACTLLSFLLPLRERALQTLIIIYSCRWLCNINKYAYSMFINVKFLHFCAFQNWLSNKINGFLMVIFSKIYY